MMRAIRPSSSSFVISVIFVIVIFVIFIVVLVAIGRHRQHRHRHRGHRHHSQVFRMTTGDITHYNTTDMSKMKFVAGSG